jgi:hypothetical protein
MKYNKKNDLTFFIISLYIESKYITKSNVYLIIYIFLKSTIVVIEYYCIAQNHSYGSCKHISNIFNICIIHYSTKFISFSSKIRKEIIKNSSYASKPAFLYVRKVSNLGVK